MHTDITSSKKEKMINIIFIHQSAELYGSDKTLLLLIKHLDKSKYFPIVILPFDGPLKTELEKEKAKVILAPVLKLYRKMITPKNIFRFFTDIKKGYSVLDSINKQHPIDIIYSNTLAVMLGFFYAKKRNIKHLWHVHEIIEKPKLFTRLFIQFLSSKNVNRIVYNSIATQQFWNKNEEIQNKGIVIWNGLEIPNKTISPIEKEHIKSNFFKAKEADITIALVGRISRWKGQQLLLNSFYEINKKLSNTHLVFIGSTPPNQEEFLIKLNQEIESLELSEKVTIIPFQEDINPFWQSIDIAIVPSIEPEPFGLVAVEAMLHQKPVVGANHGGLTEIIVNNKTGILFEPNNQKALCDALYKLVADKSLRQSMGEKGKQHAHQFFTILNYIDGIQKEFINLMKVR